MRALAYFLCMRSAAACACFTFTSTFGAAAFSFAGTQLAASNATKIFQSTAEEASIL